MEGILSGLWFLGLLLLGVIAVRNRKGILRYMRVGDYCDLSGKRRKVVLKRRIEDAEEELKIIGEKEKKGE